MKKLTIKKFIGWLLIALFLPLVCSLCTLNGKFCYHGNCDDVTPFTGGFLIGLELDAVTILVALFSWLIVYLIRD